MRILHLTQAQQLEATAVIDQHQDFVPVTTSAVPVTTSAASYANTADEVQDTLHAGLDVSYHSSNTAAVTELPKPSHGVTSFASLDVHSSSLDDVWLDHHHHTTTTPRLQQIQASTTHKLADLQAAVEECGFELGDDATEQLEGVLHQLEKLEQDLSAAIHCASQQHLQDTIVTAHQQQSTMPGVANGHPHQQHQHHSAAVLVDRPLTAVPQHESSATSSTTTLDADHIALNSVADTRAADEQHAASTSQFAVDSSSTSSSSSSLDNAKLWALFVLGLSYVHQATTGFALPAMLPMISPDLHFTDLQGAMLTSGYSYLYALALVPVGILADRVDRPKLLAVGLALWSAFSMLAGNATSFKDLLLLRVGFAAAQAAQNPVSFSLIPDLFPQNKSTALAAYNCAIYLGRALSFASVLLAHRLGDLAAAGASSVESAVAGSSAADDIALSMVPLDKLDLQRMSIIYTTGDMAAVTPVYNYNFHVIAFEAAAGGGDGGWRHILQWIGIPGFFIAALMLSSVAEPRKAAAAAAAVTAANVGKTAGSSDGIMQASASNTALSSSASSSMHDPCATRSISNNGSSSSAAMFAESAGSAASAGSLALLPRRSGSSSSSSSAGSNLLAALPTPAQVGRDWSQMTAIKRLLKMPAFQTVTAAAALNDLGSYALIAWHSTFYERVYGLDSSVYAPILAVILPVGGVLGGVGGGLIADWLSTVGGRYWLTAGRVADSAPPGIPTWLFVTSTHCVRTCCIYLGHGMAGQSKLMGCWVSDASNCICDTLVMVFCYASLPNLLCRCVCAGRSSDSQEPAG